MVAFNTVFIRNQQIVKIAGIGQATPLCQRTYNQISNLFVTDSHKLFLCIAWYTGERPEAILSLDVRHVYSDVLRRKPRECVVYPASIRKDRHTREVYMKDELKLMLASYTPPETGFLFPSLYKADQHLSRQAMDKAFRRAVKKAGLEAQGFSLYSMRRGFITHLNNLGYDIKLIQKLTGHRSLTSLIRYIDITDEQLKNAIANF